MATIYKTSGSAWQTDWTASPNDLQDGVVDSTTGGVSSFASGGALTLSTLSFETSAPATVFQTGTSFGTTLRARTAGPYNYALYLADGKTFDAAFGVQFSSSAGTTGFNVYMGAGANYIGRAFGSTIGASVINKYGSGTFTIRVLAAGGAALANYNVYEGTLRVDNSVAAATAGIFGSSGTLTLAGGTVSTGLTRTLAYTLSVNGNSAVSVDAGASATYTSASGSGTLTINGPGTTTLGSASCSILVPAGATLTMGASSSITGAAGATVSGTGTIAMNGGTFGTHAPSFTGAVTGTFTVAEQAGRSGLMTFAFNNQGICSTSNGIHTFTGSSPSGRFGTIGYSVVKLYQPWLGGASTTVTQSGVGNPSWFHFYGAGTLNSTCTIALSNAASVGLFQAASVSSPITANSTTASVILVGDGTATTYSGSFSTNQASGLVKVMAATGGTLTLSGTFTSSNAGRQFGLNEDATYTDPDPEQSDLTIGGIIKVTGAGFSGAASTLKRGTLYLNSASSVGVGTTLTVSGSGTTVACSSTGPYAAQITGNMSFGAGTVLRFGAPA